ncbi:MAG TPA: hypothetical protein VEQ40_06350 [Pyrinomonadaceae bacterium]|nr:hypothetical protein [Pyrinomonadaceae bacterium]
MNYSLDSYRLIIERAQAAGYAFLPFTLDERPVGKRIYLRHDVDYSLEMALELARINAALGVSATFCVLLRSQIYNLLSSWSLELVGQIHALGQQIGLHATTAESEVDEIEKELRADFDFARRNLPMMSEVFCWHNPTPEVLKQSEPFERMAGLVNAYGERFTRDIAYFSDSNMRNSVEDFLRHVESGEHQAMQLLFHPFNWVAGGSNMREILAGTWQYVIRERDREVSINRAYRQMLPEGIPDSVLRAFSEKWSEAAEANG